MRGLANTETEGDSSRVSSVAKVICWYYETEKVCIVAGSVAGLGPSDQISRQYFRLEMTKEGWSGL